MTLAAQRAGSSRGADWRGARLPHKRTTITWSRARGQRNCRASAASHWGCCCGLAGGSCRWLCNEYGTMLYVRGWPASYYFLLADRGSPSAVRPRCLVLLCESSGFVLLQSLLLDLSVSLIKLSGVTRFRRTAASALRVRRELRPPLPPSSPRPPPQTATQKNAAPLQKKSPTAIMNRVPRSFSTSARVHPSFLPHLRHSRRMPFRWYVALPVCAL